MVALAPCAGCARHIKIADGRCPFCGAHGVVASPRGFSRAGRVAAIAAMAAAAGCGDGTNVDAGGPVPEYGAAIVDAGDPDGGSDAGDFGGGEVPLYGSPDDNP